MFRIACPNGGTDSSDGCHAQMVGVVNDHFENRPLLPYGVLEPPTVHVADSKWRDWRDDCGAQMVDFLDEHSLNRHPLLHQCRKNVFLEHFSLSSTPTPEIFSL